MRKQVERYIEASKVYVEKEKIKEDVIGIVISGSMVYGSLDKNSDIDVHVILAPHCDYRERGNLWINGVEVEYFKNPPTQIRSYFEKETKSPHTAHMLAHGTLVYSQSELVEDLVTTAKTIIQQIPPKLKPFEVEFEKYFIDDYYKDFEDAVLNKDLLGANMIRHKIVNRSIDVFCKIHQVRRGKDKRLSQQIERLDPMFIQYINLALNENWQEAVAMEELRTATEGLLGGRRTEEWKLRSKLDL